VSAFDDAIAVVIGMRECPGASDVHGVITTCGLSRASTLADGNARLSAMFSALVGGCGAAAAGGRPALDSGSFRLKLFVRQIASRCAPTDVWFRLRIFCVYAS